MATSPMSEVIQHLRRTVLLQDEAGLTDGQLLEDYISRRDEAALATLVRRRGPLVWGVCRRVLGNYHDAEDAFQATFLVLVRKAASITPREMVANWLYGVARQTALKARATAARRKGRERQVTEMPEPAVAEQDLWHDLQPLLDQELSRLPDKYRAIIVLCDLEANTRKEAARQLGCPEGTVAGRLARARVMLAKRLAQRGVVLSGGALAAVLSQTVASAGVPTSVVSSAIKAASTFAAGKAAATGAISVQVAALTEGVLKAMFLTKLKTLSVVLLVVAALSGAAGLIYQTQAAEQPKTQAATEKADKEKPPAARKPETKTDKDRLQGEWKLEDSEIGGRTDADLKELRKIKWLIEGDKITIGKGDGRDATGSVKVDPTRKPKEIDITLTAGGPPAGHKAYPGIYKLDGGRLTVCYAFQADVGQPRPTEFDTKGGANLVVLVRSAQEKATGKGDKEKPPAPEEENNSSLEGLVKAQTEEVKAKVVELNQALWKDEYAKAVDLMPPYLIDKQGGREKMLATMKRVMEKMKSHYTLLSYEVGDPMYAVRAGEAGGGNRYVTFSTTTKLAQVADGMPSPGVVTSQAFAVGISVDHGKTWKVVNGDQHPFRDHVEDFFGAWLRLPTLSTVEAEGPEITAASRR